MPHSFSVENILGSYPRLRTPLSPAHREIYVAHYQENREGDGWLTGFKNDVLEAWMHKRIALRQHGTDVLEIGAGTLNHLVYEPANLSYDAVEPFKELWEGRGGLSRLRTLYQSIDDIPPQLTYDRIFSIAVLEHLTELPRIVAASALRLRPEGRYQAAIPSEGGLLWGLAWRLSTGVSFRLRTGLSYKEVMRHEHVNTADEILAVCRWLFAELEVERTPTGLHHLSVYSVLEARGPRIERCRSIMAGHQP